MEIGAAVCLEVRAKLGQPTRSRANQTLVSQRCAAWLEEHAPHLRKCYYQNTLAMAVVFALTPSRDEVLAARYLNDAEVADREYAVHGPATIPMFRGRLGEILSVLPWFRVPARQDF